MIKQKQQILFRFWWRRPKHRRPKTQTHSHKLHELATGRTETHLSKITLLLILAIKSFDTTIGLKIIVLFNHFTQIAMVAITVPLARNHHITLKAVPHWVRMRISHANTSCSRFYLYHIAANFALRTFEISRIMWYLSLFFIQ